MIVHDRCRDVMVVHGRAVMAHVMFMLMMAAVPAVIVPAMAAAMMAIAGMGGLVRGGEQAKAGESDREQRTHKTSLRYLPMIRGGKEKSSGIENSGKPTAI